MEQKPGCWICRKVVFVGQSRDPYYLQGREAEAVAELLRCQHRPISTRFACSRTAPQPDGGHGRLFPPPYPGLWPAEDAASAPELLG